MITALAGGPFFVHLVWRERIDWHDVDGGVGLDSGGVFGAGTEPERAYAVREVHFAYGQSRPSDGRWVLQDVTLEVERRDPRHRRPQRIWKTSLLKLLAKLAVPQDGRSHCSGRLLTTLSQEQIAWTPLWSSRRTIRRCFFTVAETVLMDAFTSAAFGMESGIRLGGGRLSGSRRVDAYHGHRASRRPRRDGCPGANASHDDRAGVDAISESVAAR